MPRDYRPNSRSTPPRSRRRVAVFVGLALLVLIVGTLFTLRAIFFPFLVAALIAYVLEPSVARVERVGVPRLASVLLVILFFFAAIWGFGYSLLPKLAVEGQKGMVRIQEFLGDVPDMYQSVEEDIDAFFLTSEEGSEDPEEARKAVSELSPPPKDPGSEADSLQALPPVKMPAHSRELWETEGLVKSSPSDRARWKTQAEREAILDSSHVVVEEIRPGSYGLRLRDSSFEFGGGSGRLNITPRTERAPDDRFATLRSDLARSVIQGIESTASTIVGGVVKMTRTLFASLFEGMISATLMFIVTTFLLLGMPHIRASFEGFAPPRFRDDYRELVHAMDRGLSGVVRGQLMICLVNGVLSGIGFLFFIPEYAFAMAVLAGVMSLIPIFGTIISSIPVVLIAFTDSPANALGVLSWILGIHFLEANVLNPKIIGTSASIHPILVIFALIAGEYLHGMAGLLLAVPAFSLLQSIVQFVWRRVKPVLEEELA